MRILALVAFLIASRSVLAQVDPVIRMSVEPSSVRVGEALSLRITVLVPTYFPRPPVYPDFEVANAITRLPPDSSYPTSERVDGASWSGIVREYRIYPLTAANYRIDGQTMRVTYADPGSGPVLREVAVPRIAFRATVPAGAGSLDPYVAGSALDVTVDVEGNERDLGVGDAVVLTYRATLVGLPSLFLPPLATGVDDLAADDSVTVYADAPRFEDDDGTATRTERVTLLFNTGGEFRVPAVAIDYWNTADETVRTARSEPLLFTVSGPAVELSADETGAENPGRWTFALLLGALVLVLGIALRRANPVVQDRLGRWRRSETCAFWRLRRDLSTRSDEETYRSVQRWLERLEPGLGPRTFAGVHGDDALQAAIDALGDHVFGGMPTEVDRRRLEAHLVDARQRYLGRRGAPDTTRLAPLNP